MEDAGSMEVTVSSFTTPIACERRRISGYHLVPPKNNVCEPEPENDFCDVMTCFSLANQTP